MFVKPGPNPRKPGSLLKVRIPHTKALLSEEGAEVPENQFWLRRVRDSDVLRVQPPAAPEVAPAPVQARSTIEGK
jgi:hypothetical protein